MAESSLYGGERSGARIFRVGRVGFDSGGSDLDSHVYTGTLRTERFPPAGVGSLVNFRRINIHLLSSGTYEFTVRVWVDDTRTALGDDSEQEVVISGGLGSLVEITEEIKIQAVGSHVQVEIEINSDDTTGIFLIESIDSRGRVIRASASRSGESS